MATVLTPGQTRPLTPHLQQHLPPKTHQVNSAHLIFKGFPGCLYSTLYFTGLVPSFPEVPMTTVEAITVIFCCLFLLALALSFGYTHKMCLQGVCDINRHSSSYIICLLVFTSSPQLKATVLKDSLSGPWSYFLLVFHLTCSSTYEAFNQSSRTSQEQQKTSCP